jgi:hypothetical protein
MCHTTGPNVAGTFEGRPLTIVSRLFQGYPPDNDMFVGPQNCPERIKVGDSWRRIDPHARIEQNTLDPSEGDREDNRLLLNARPISALVVPMVCHRQVAVYRRHYRSCRSPVRRVTQSQNPLASNRISPALVQSARLLESN